MVVGNLGIPLLRTICAVDISNGSKGEPGVSKIEAVRFRGRA